MHSSRNSRPQLPERKLFATLTCKVAKVFGDSGCGMCLLYPSKFKNHDVICTSPTGPNTNPHVDRLYARKAQLSTS